MTAISRCHPAVPIGLRGHLLLTVLTLLVPLGCSSSDSQIDPTPDSGTECVSTLSRPLILHGDLDFADPAVASVNLLTTECMRSGSPVCTGTLVGPGLVLTAGHCADPPAPALFGVLFGASGDAGEGPLGEGLDGQFFQTTEFRIHPGFDAETLANDVAVLLLDGSPALEPMPLFPSPLTPDLVGAEVKLVGFGLSDATDGDSSSKRAGIATIQTLGDDDFTYVPGPAMTCEGDSGGPVILTDGGRDFLLGITSRGDGTCSEYGKAVRVDRIPANLLAQVGR